MMLPVGVAVCGPLCGSCGRSPERNERGTCDSEPPARSTPSRQAGRLIPTTCVKAAGTANAARWGRQPFLPRALPGADTFPRRRAIPIHRPARMTSYASPGVVSGLGCASVTKRICNMARASRSPRNHAGNCASIAFHTQAASIISCSVRLANNSDRAPAAPRAPTVVALFGCEPIERGLDFLGEEPRN